MIVVVDYGLGNLGSIVNMLKKVGVRATMSSDPELIADADRLILPGVGAFDNGMRNLSEKGLIPILNQKVLSDGTPILGICLGMQLFTEESEEGILPGLGWIRGRTIRFRIDQPSTGLRIPHMGWNRLTLVRPSGLLRNIEANARYYFVHSYHVVCEDEEDVLATTHYGYTFPSAIERHNIFGTQFHPEKSHRFGVQLFRDFLESC